MSHPGGDISRETETMEKHHTQFLESESAIPEVKTSPDGLNRVFERVGGSIWKLRGGSLEVIQLEEQKKNEERRPKTRGPAAHGKHDANTHTRHGRPRRRGGERGRKEQLKKRQARRNINLQEAQ